jgi:hypothetical protein
MSEFIRTDNPFLDQETLNENQRELENFMKCIEKNEARLLALCSIEFVCSATEDDERPAFRDALVDIISQLVHGNMKVNGEANNWSNGTFGSRWFDYDASSHGLGTLRCAFYSKKTSTEWECDKPYMIQVSKHDEDECVIA